MDNYFSNYVSVHKKTENPSPKWTDKPTPKWKPTGPPHPGLNKKQKVENPGWNEKQNVENSGWKTTASGLNEKKSGMNPGWKTTAPPAWDEMKSGKNPGWKNKAPVWKTTTPTWKNKKTGNFKYSEQATKICVCYYFFGICKFENTIS